MLTKQSSPNLKRPFSPPREQNITRTLESSEQDHRHSGPARELVSETRTVIAYAPKSALEGREETPEVA